MLKFKHLKNTFFPALLIYITFCNTIIKLLTVTLTEFNRTK